MSYSVKESENGLGLNWTVCHNDEVIGKFEDSATAYQFCILIESNLVLRRLAFFLLITNMLTLYLLLT